MGYSEDFNFGCSLNSIQSRLYQVIIEHLEELLAKTKVQNFKKDQMLFYRGHFPCGFFIVQDGHLNLLGSRKSHSRPLSAPPGQIIGLSPLVSEKAYNKTGCVVADMKASFIPKGHVIDLLGRLAAEDLKKASL